MFKLISYLCLLTVIGCNESERYHEEYVCRLPITIVLCDNATMCERLKLKQDIIRNGYYTKGCCLPDFRTVYVPKTSKGLPDFEVLGHEIWHFNEFGGAYHGSLTQGEQ